MKQFFNLSIFIVSFSVFISAETYSQNSLVGDGFGGRLWYKPSNYTVGSYSAYSICYTGLCSDGPNELRGWGSNGTNQLGLGNLVSETNTPVAFLIWIMCTITAPGTLWELLKKILPVGFGADRKLQILILQRK